MATRRKRRTEIPVATSRDYSLLLKLLPAWMLPSVSPVYEIWLAKQAFPVGIELLLLAVVFIYCACVCGFKRIGQSFWFATCAIFGSIAFINILLGLSGFSNGKPILGLMIFLLCAGISWAFAINSNSEQSTDTGGVSLQRKGKIDLAITYLVGALSLWAIASLFDAFLVGRLFFINTQTNKYGGWFVLLIFVVSLVASFYDYWQDTNGSRLRKFLMPIAVSFLISCISLGAFIYGKVFAIHALAVGQQKDIVYVVKELHRDASRRSLCPYAASFRSLDGQLSNRHTCITANQYKKLKVGDQISTPSLVTQFGALVVSPTKFLNTNPRPNDP